MASSGNFCVLTVLNPDITTYTSPGIDHAGTRITSKTGNAASATFGFRKNDGKFYWELCPTVNITNSAMMGFAGDDCDTNNYPTSGPGFLYNATNGQKAVSSSSSASMGSTTSYGASWTNGDVIGCAVDWTGSTAEFFKNNVSQGSIDISGLNDGTVYYPFIYGNVHVIAANFGADSSFQGFKTAQGNSDENGFGDFYYTPPSGFLAMCSSNRVLSDDVDPAQTDDDYSGTKQFNAIKYVGNGGTSSNNITYGFRPDLVWGKDLDGVGGGYSPHVWDSTRGDDYYMYSNGTAASTTSGSDYLEFTSTGIKIDESWAGINQNGANYISFGWRANGGTTSTNNEGNHTSTVQANTVGGFSIISYANYTSASGVTVGHGLTQAPDLYIHKSTANTSNWNVYHHSLGATKALVMNSLAGEATAVGYWANTEPTADVLSLGNGFAGTGAGIVYAWHEVPGLSKFGKYDGSGTTDGRYIDLGFRPKMVWIKRSSSASITYGWNCFIDSINDNVNKAQFKGWWLDQYVGASSNYPLDFLSTGFKHRNNNANLDASGVEYVYMAWADTSSKYSVGF